MQILAAMTVVTAISSSCAPMAQDVQDAPPDMAEERAPEAPASAEELLSMLEADGAKLRDFRALVHMRKYDSLAEETEWFVGEAVYRYDPDRSRPKRFAILFNKKGTIINGDAELRDLNEHYIFDGEWLAERLPDEKQLILRQIVAPGEDFDPLKLGEGPFPMPIGQKRADVLERFDARLIDRPIANDVPPDDGAFENNEFFLRYLDQDVWGLELTPKAETLESEEYKTIEIYYDSKTLLPAGLRTIMQNDNREYVLFLKRERDAGVDEAIFDTSIPDETWSFSRIEWDELRGEEDDE